MAIGLVLVVHHLLLVDIGRSDAPGGSLLQARSGSLTKNLPLPRFHLIITHVTRQLLVAV